MCLRSDGPDQGHGCCSTGMPAQPECCTACCSCAAQCSSGTRSAPPRGAGPEHGAHLPMASSALKRSQSYRSTVSRCVPGSRTSSRNSSSQRGASVPLRTWLDSTRPVPTDSLRGAPADGLATPPGRPAFDERAARAGPPPPRGSSARAGPRAPAPRARRPQRGRARRAAGAAARRGRGRTCRSSRSCPAGPCAGRARPPAGARSACPAAPPARPGAAGRARMCTSAAACTPCAGAMTRLVAEGSYCWSLMSRLLHNNNTLF